MDQFDAAPIAEHCCKPSLSGTSGPYLITSMGTLDQLDQPSYVAMTNAVDSDNATETFWRLTYILASGLARLLLGNRFL